VAFTKFRTAQPFGPYLRQGNNLDAKEKLAKAFGPDQLALSAALVQMAPVAGQGAVIATHGVRFNRLA
jgi:hypothetical protein